MSWRTIDSPRVRVRERAELLIRPLADLDLDHGAARTTHPAKVSDF